MSTSYNNVDGNYSIYVMACNRGFPDRNPAPSPRVSIIWRVTESYKSEKPSFKRLIIKRSSSSHQYDDVFGAISFTDDNYMSSESRDIISGMLSDINFAFELERLIWKPLGYPNSTRKLNNADDIVSQILELIHDMVVKGRKVNLVVEVDKQYTVPHEKYEAKVKAEKERELAECIFDVDTTRQTEMARVRDRRMADMVGRICADKYNRIAEEMPDYNISEERVMHIVRELESEVVRESFNQAVIKPRPASKASIEALEKFLVEDGEMCVICREEMTACKVIRMPCSHMFHENCIVKWLSHWNHTCPLCNFNMPESLLIKN